MATGAATGIGALPTLADGHHPRALMQEWARAVHEDDPSSGGEVQDLALSDPRVLARVTAGLDRRRVVVRTCGPDECPRCPS